MQLLSHDIHGILGVLGLMASKNNKKGISMSILLCSKIITANGCQIIASARNMGRNSSYLFFRLSFQSILPNTHFHQRETYDGKRAENK